MTAAPATASATMTSAVASASATTTASALALRTGFIHHQRAAKEILAVQRLNRLFRFRIVSDFREAESARLPGKTIAQKRERIRLHSDFRKQRRYLLFCSLERQISHVQFLHGRSPYAPGQRRGAEHEAEETGSRPHAALRRLATLG